MEQKRIEVLKLYAEGKSYQQIATLLNMSKSTVAYCIKEKDNIEKINKQKQKIEQQIEYEKLVCNLAQQRTNINQICAMLNKRATNTNYEQIKKILERHNIDTSHFTYNPVTKRNTLTFNDIFCKNSKLKNNSKLKDNILKNSLKDRICEKCQNTHWNGELIPLEVHHINGDRHDNRIENLQFLCPNCHAQTDNFCGKNIKKTLIPANSSKKKKIINKLSKCPDKNVLINDFKTKGSFKQVGVIHGVSDNTVKKWFKKYGLPTSSPEMRKQIIQEYGKQPQWYEYVNNRNYSKSIEKLGIKVNVYNSDGTFIKQFDSISQASAFVGIGTRTLGRALKGNNIKDKRFIFEKVEI